VTTTTQSSQETEKAEFLRVHGDAARFPADHPSHPGRERNASVRAVLIHFEYAHLTRPAYRECSRKFCELAYRLSNELPEGPDLVKSLNELKIAKDWAVCALVAADKAAASREGAQ
jgi:hypothetical protein